MMAPARRLRGRRFSLGLIAGMMVCLAFAGDVAADPGELSFQQHDTYQAWADDIEVLDLDVDGDRDIVLGGTERVAINRGDGTFDLQQGSFLGFQTLTTGDLDGDGRTDLVGSIGRTVSVLVNRGAGSFEAIAQYAMPGYVSEIRVADLDGSNGSDVIVAVGSIPSGVLVLWNDGSGTFAASDLLPMPSAPVALAAGDLDGDEVADLVVASDVVAVFKGRPSRDLTASCTIPEHSWNVAIEDVDDQPGNELVLQADDHLAVYRDFKCGAPREPVRSALPAIGHSGRRSMTVADINQDGVLDVALAYMNDPGYTGVGLWVSVMFGAGTGRFVKDVDYNLLLFSGGCNPDAPSALESADFDGDGWPDLACLPSCGVLAVLLNLRDGTLKGRFDVPVPEIEGAPFRRGFRFETGRFTNLDRDDIVAIDENRTVLLRSRPNATLLPPVLIADGGFSLVSDLDRDGDSDLIIGHSILLNSGEGKFVPGRTYPGEGVLASGEIDGRSGPDLAMRDAEGRLLIRLNDGHGSFDETWTTGFPLGSEENGEVRAAQIIDMDQDGKGEIAIGWYPGIDQSNGKITSYRVHSNGVHETGRYAVGGDNHDSPAMIREIEAGDVDGDGWPDLVVLLNWDDAGVNVASVLRNAGDGSLQPQVIVAVPYSGGSGNFVLTDLDGDRISDLVATTANGSAAMFCSVFQGVSGIGLVEAGTYLVGDYPVWCAVGDFNGDQRPDIATSAARVSSITILRNSTEPDQPTPALVSWIGADKIPGGLRLRWYSHDSAWESAVVERRQATGDWSTIGRVIRSGSGELVFDDRHTVPGVRYAYRLARERGIVAGEAWVDAPRAPAGFGISSLASPVRDRLRIALTGTLSTPIVLQLYDVLGRRVAQERLEVSGESAIVDLGDVSQWAAGVYWVRATQSGAIASTKLVIAR